MKPLLVVRFPSRLPKMINISFGELYDLLIKNISEQCPDYTILILWTEGEEFVIECFNAENIPEADIEKLKEEVRSTLKAYENKTDEDRTQP